MSTLPPSPSSLPVTPASARQVLGQGWQQTKTLFGLGRFWVVLASLSLPLVVDKLLHLSDKLSFPLAYGILSIGTFVGLHLLPQTLQNPFPLFWVYQVLFFVIFIDAKLLAAVGLNLKVYALGFAFASAVFGLQSLQKLGVLWQRFWVFRLLGLFLGLSLLFIALGHFSEFRLTSDWMALQANSALKPGQGASVHNTREHGAFSQYLIYIESVIPLLVCSAGLLLSTLPGYIRQPRRLLFDLMRVFPTLVLLNYGLSVLLFAVGKNSAPNSIEAVVDSAIVFYFPHIFVSLLALGYLASNWKQLPAVKRLNQWLFAGVFSTLVMVALSYKASGSSSMMAAILLGGSSLLLLMKLQGFRFAFIRLIDKLLGDPETSLWSKVLRLGLSALGLAAVVGAVALALGENFQGDLSSVGTRFIHWRDILHAFQENLSLVSVFFGYGIDSVRETIYHSSLSSGIEKNIQSPHNFFLLMGFDYGLSALVYFAAFYLPALHSLLTLLQGRSKRYPQGYRVLCAWQVALTASMSFMWFFLDPTLPYKVVCFASLGLLEAGKWLFQRQLVPKP
jgi:hypothetical protein